MDRTRTSCFRYVLVMIPSLPPWKLYRNGITAVSLPIRRSATDPERTLAEGLEPARTRQGGLGNSPGSTPRRAHPSMITLLAAEQFAARGVHDGRFGVQCPTGVPFQEIEQFDR